MTDRHDPLPARRPPPKDGSAPLRTYEHALADAVKARDPTDARERLSELVAFLRWQQPSWPELQVQQRAIQDVLTAAGYQKEAVQTHARRMWEPMLGIEAEPPSSAPPASSAAPVSLQAEAVAIGKVAEALDELATREEQCRAMAMVATALGYYDHASAFLEGAARARRDGQ